MFIATNWRLCVSKLLVLTNLAVVRGLPTKKFLPKCVNEKSSTERAAKVVRPTDLLNNVKHLVNTD